MRIKVYLFSKYAKARAQSFSVFVLSIFTNGSHWYIGYILYITTDIWLVGWTSQQLTHFILPEFSKIKYRNRERLFPVLSIIKKKKNESRPTDPRFFWHVTVNTHIFFVGLSKVISCTVFVLSIFTNGSHWYIGYILYITTDIWLVGWTSQQLTHFYH
jgi:hypothetical protein